MKRSMTVLAIVMIATAGTAKADGIGLVLLSFEGIPFGNQVGNYYCGGGGPNFGVCLSPGFDVVQGGITTDPVPNAAVEVLNGTLDVAAGFHSAFSFYWNGAPGGEVDIYSGLDGQGQLLRTFSLPGTSDFYPVGTPFPGTAESVVFKNIPSGIVDNMGLGGLVIPEPVSILLLSTALGIFSALARRRRVQ
jgi:hypothetical protein